MSYTIGRIIYGVPIKYGSELAKALPDDILDNNEHNGFFRLYEGTNVAYFGVSLGEVNETKDVILADLQIPTTEAHEEYYDKVEKLSEELKMRFAHPKWMIVWESS